MKTYDPNTFNKCAICGNPVHPIQETSAEPLSDGIACVSCAYGRVYPTKCNKGIPSHKVTEKNPQTGRWETLIVPDNPKQKDFFTPDKQ